jgi:hypothetical protein
MKFNLDDYTNRECMMHCSKYNYAVEFLKILEKNGRTWCDRRPYSEETNWWKNEENTVYYFNRGKYGNIDYVQTGTLLRFEDFI